MRKITQTLLKENLILENVLSFPKHLTTTIWDNPNLTSFRFMIDSELGADSNNGLSWNTPLKTLQSAILKLPKNLNGAHVFLLCHPGTYDSFSAENFSNGFIRLCWVGTFINQSSAKADPNGFLAWARNDVANPIRNNNQLIIEKSAEHDFIVSGTSDFEYGFWARDWNLAWNNQSYYNNKILLRLKSGYSSHRLFTIANCIFYNESPFTINLDGCTNCGIVFAYLKNSSLCGITILGANNGVSNSTNTWHGVFYTEAYKCEILFRDLVVSCDASAPFTNPSISWYAMGIRNILSTGANMFYAEGLNFEISNISYAQGHLPDTDNPIINIGSAAKNCSFKFNSTQFRLTDASTNPHSIYFTDQSKKTTFFAPQLFAKGDSLIQSLPSTAPPDADLSNNFASFWKDETNNLLYFKVKYSTGVIKSGSISLT